MNPAGFPGNTGKYYHKKKYSEGEFFHYLGAPYPLTVCSQVSGHPSLNFTGSSFHLNNNIPAHSFPLFLSWFTDATYTFLRECLPFWSREIGVRPHSVRVRFAYSRWGSCGVKGNLNFNSRLGTQAPHLIHYVVVHELCHLKQHNHSPAFWKEVETFLPNWKTLRAELKEMTEQSCF